MEQTTIIKRKPDHGYLDNMLWVPRGYINVEGTKRALTYEIQNYGDFPTYIYLWKEAPYHMLLPRAFWNPGELPFPVIDCRPRRYEHIPFKSNIKLDHLPQLVGDEIKLRPTGKTLQQDAISALFYNPTGILQLACGKGKTVIALEKIAKGKVPALVMLDNTNLLYQWKKEAEALLEIPDGIGLIADGKKVWKKGLVLATYHSIANWSDSIPEEVKRWFGQVFWDEGHHVGAPTFAKTADLFYGNRYSLTATPFRDDGAHVIASAHIGPVLYKDLTPTMNPTFVFFWTSLAPDMRDPIVANKVRDSNGEVHLKKLSGYFGEWDARLNLILEICREAYALKRRILVLTDSVAEAVNLYAFWNNLVPSMGKYSDIPIPTPEDLGETISPILLTKRELNQYKRRHKKLEELLKKEKDSNKLSRLTQEHIDLSTLLEKHNLQTRIINEYRKRQKAYITKALNHVVSGGLLIYDVPPEKRQAYLDECLINFSSTKYGKEGLDCQALDTIVLSSLFTSSNSLQQLMGRPTRPSPGKKNPLIIALVDDVGQSIGMSKKLQSHLRSWPKEEGGPYEPILLNYPTTWKTKQHPATLMDILAQ